MDVPERLLAGGAWPGVTLAQVTFVAALGLLAWLATRRGGPSLRGAVVLAALVGLLAVPALAMVAPVWLPLPGLARPAAAPEAPGPGLSAPAPPPPAAEGPAVPAVAPAEPAGNPPPGPDDPMDPFDDFEELTESVEPAVTAPSPPAEAAPPAPPGQPRPAPTSVAGILVAVWLLGVLAYLARALACLARLYRWAWRARPIPEAEWAACLETLADRDRRPRVAVRESPAVDSPLTLGVLRPVVLLPAGWRRWSAEQLRLVLLHELAHVRRRDFLAGLVAELAVCLCWFHPLVRWLAGRLRLEQEYAADARAASAAGDAMTYVRCLARLALEQGAGRGSPAPALWRRRPEILRRIDMLRRNRDGLAPRLGRGTTCAVVVLAAAACVAAAGIGPLRAVANTPADPAPAAADSTEAKAPAAAAADVYGDPLPAGARARLGTTRWRHGSAVNYLGFGPEGKTLVTAGQDGTARLWDVDTGKEVRRFARPAPTGARPGVGPVRPPAPAAAEAAAKARRELAEIEAAAAAAKAKLETAKAGPEADALKRKIEATKAKAAALKAELEAQLRQRVLGNPAGSLSVALTDGGKTLAVAGGNVIQLYEVQTGAELRKIDGPPTGLVGLLFSPDGKTLAGRTPDGAVTLWDAETGTERRRVKAPATPTDPRTRAILLRGGGDTPGMAFTPDSAALAVAAVEFKEQSVTGRVVLWDVASGEEGREVKAVEGAPVSAVALAPGGKVLVYCANGIVHACDVKTGAPLFESRLAEPAVGLLFSPDGKRLAVRGRSQQVRVCDAADGKELYVLGDPPAARAGAAAFVLARPLSFAPETRPVAFSPDGRRIATAADGTVRLWAAATGKELPTSDGHHGPPAAVVVAPDGGTVVTLGADRTVRRWDAATGKPLGSFRLPPGAAALSPDGRTAAVAGPDGVIRLHETAGGKEIGQFKGSPRGAAALAFSPDGKALAERGGDGTIRLYDPAKGAELRQFAAQAAGNPYPPGVVVAVPGRFPGAPASGLVFSPDGKLLASSSGSSPAVVAAPVAAGGRGRPNGATINLFDVGTGKAIRKIEPTPPVISFAFSPDGRVLATENADESVILWEVASGKERARLGGRAVAVAPQMPGATAGLVRVVVAGGPGFAEPAGPATLAFSPDGRLLVARGPDRSARAWDVIGSKEVGQLTGHDGRIETVFFSPDGKIIASGSTDTTVLLWDAAALRENLPAPTSAELTDGAAEAAWADLAGEEAGKARQGVLKLAGDPRRAVPVLAERLMPAAPIDQKKLERWVADLESDKFAVRREAAAELVKAGEQAVPALQRVLASRPTIETRLRVEGLLDKLTGGTLTAEQLRTVRAVEALEMIGTPEARGLLRTLAGGAPGALPTREARAALDRLGGR